MAPVQLDSISRVIEIRRNDFSVWPGFVIEAEQHCFNSKLRGRPWLSLDERSLRYDGSLLLMLVDR